MAMTSSGKLRPCIDGPWWEIAPKPVLEDRLPVLSADYPNADERQRNQPNDHHLFQAADGTWHLWACVRRTPVGRLLVNWEADSLETSPWRLTGRLIRADREAGESMVDWQGEEFLQSPYVVRANDRYYLFYGGYDTGTDSDGAPTNDYTRAEKQICLMTSVDGRAWERHRDGHGRSRVFAGPGAARDECVVRFGDTWYMYYTGHHDRDRRRAAIYVRTSADLLTWSDWRIAERNTADERSFIPESPVVVRRGGAYYLFRTHGPRHGTYVFRSDDPLDFGSDCPTERSPHFVCRLPIVAPEIVTDENGAEYITRIDDAVHGYRIRMARLRWSER